MSTINSFLQKVRLHENHHGIFMVVIAYVVSAALLILGSDAFYGITTKAEKISSQVNEETKLEDKKQIINPYGVTDTSVSASIEDMNRDLKVSNDTYWLLGSAMDSEEYHSFLAKLEEAGTDQTVTPVTITEDENSIESLSVITADEKLVKSVTLEEVTMLERIVEAEASGEDMVGRILIANVIFNRISDDDFPDTIKEVIFHKVGGDYQFSPISDERYWNVKVSKKTKEAVQRALEGEDYSEGALYFMARKRTNRNSAKWFDDNLDWLFKHGGHEFYKNR